MAHAYIARWEWHDGGGTELSRWQAPGAGCLGCVDLRSLPQMGQSGGTPEGSGVFSYPALQTIPGSVYLGQNLDRALTETQRGRLKQAWRLSTLNSVTVRDVLWDRMTKHTDPTGMTGPKPIRGRVGRIVKMTLGGFGVVREERFNATHRQRTIDVWKNDYHNSRGKMPLATLRRQTGRMMQDMHGRMGDDLLASILPAEFTGDGWRRPQTSISDNFNRADSASLGANWTERQGNYDIVSNRLKKISGTATANVAYHNTALSSADYHVQIIVNVADTMQHRGPCARRVDFSTSDSDLYTPLLTTTGNDLDLYKRVSGSWTKLDDQSASYSVSTDYTIKMEVESTNIRSWFDGTAKSTDAWGTDSSLSAAGFAGIITGDNRADDDVYDDFEAADLAAASDISIFRRRLEND